MANQNMNLPNLMLKKKKKKKAYKLIYKQRCIKFIILKKNFLFS